MVIIYGITKRYAPNGVMLSTENLLKMVGSDCLAQLFVSIDTGGTLAVRNDLFYLSVQYILPVEHCFCNSKSVYFLPDTLDAHISYYLLGIVLIDGRT